MPKTSNKKAHIIRQNWGKEYSAIPELDLLAIQKKSYDLFLEKGIPEI
jgi:hypothetical protein